MADATIPTPTPPKKRRWLRRLVWVAGILVLLLVVVYFVATSSAFLTGVILPRVSKAMNAQVTVSDASIHPFKEVVLHNLKVQTTGTEPLLTVPEVRLRYSLMDIISGKINVEEVAISSPTVTLIQNPDGTTSLDPILKSQKTEAAPKEKTPAAPAKPSKPAQIDLKKFALTDATVHVTKLYAGGNKDVVELSHINVTLSDLKNGQTGRLTLAAQVGVDSKPPAPGTNALMQAKVNGTFDFALTADLKPASVKGSTRLDVTRAEGALTDLAAFGEEISVEMTPTDIKGVALKFSKGGTQLGEARLSGPFDIEKMEGRLVAELLPIDKKLLNIAGAKAGLDFGPTTMSSSNFIQIAKSGMQITANGRFNLNQFQVTRAGQTTPPLNLQSEYGVAIDRAASNTILNVFTLNATQNGSSILHGELTSPLPISSGGDTKLGDATLNLALTHFDLAAWRPFLGDNQLAGDINFGVQVVSQQGGKLTSVVLTSQINNLTAATGSVHIAQMTIKGALKDNNLGSDQHDVSGTLALADFTGQMGTTSLRNFGVESTLDVNSTPKQILIRKIAGKLTQGSDAGGSFEMTGTFDVTNKSAQINAKLVDLNQNALRPFLEPALGDKKLVSVTINANTSAQYAPPGDSAVKADFQMRNLVVNDPANQIPATPLEATMQLDAAMHKQIADVKLFQFGLTPTARATNQVQLTGQVDMSDTNAITGHLKLASDAIDLTTYYDLFVGGKKPAGKQTASTTPTAAPAPTPGSAPADPNAEPPAKKLPLHNFTAEMNIRHFYLHEVDISDLQEVTKIDGGHVTVNPFKLAVNGAPANATVDLDLGVPGYKYDVAFKADSIPLAPLVNSFQPDRKGQVGGTFTAVAKITGAGASGANLQKNLSGQFDMGSTNLNLSVVNIRSPVLKTLINVITIIPELASNPAGAASSLLGSLTGNTVGSGGLADDLAKSPIDAITARGTMGSGRVDLQQAAVQSPAFRAEASGPVTLAAVLTNSTLQIPVTVALSRPLAQRLNMVPAGTPTNALYAKLPDFLTIKGTVGNPKTDINKLALAGSLLKGVGSGISGVGGKAENLIQGLLGGGTPASTNAPGATNKPPPKSSNLLQGLGGLLGNPSPSTNSPSTPKK